MIDEERLEELEERLLAGDITAEELDEYNSFFKDEDEEENKNSNLTFNDFYNDFKKTTDSIKETLFPKVEQKASNVLDEMKKISKDIKPLLPNNVGDVKQKAKSGVDKLKNSVKNASVPTIPFTQRNCNHELFYLLCETPSYNYESKLFKSIDNHRCVCKCLSCGKEVTVFKSNLGCNVICENEEVRSDERYNKARNRYLSLKFHKCNGQELINKMYEELEKDKVKSNVPKLKL